MRKVIHIFLELISAFFYTGYLKASGTFATLLTLPFAAGAANPGKDARIHGNPAAGERLAEQILFVGIKNIPEMSVI